MVLHGGGASARQVMGLAYPPSPLSLFLEIAAREDIVVIAPDAGKGEWSDCFASGARAAAKTDAERERALLVLRSAAERGLAQAQYDLGVRYEKGDGLPADMEEAQRWYEKSAAQDNVLAVQRVKRGPLKN